MTNHLDLVLSLKKLFFFSVNDLFRGGLLITFKSLSKITRGIKLIERNLSLVEFSSDFSSDRFMISFSMKFSMFLSSLSDICPPRGCP